MAEHSAVKEIEKEAKKLKRDLESWREIILPINSILLWEQDYYSGIIVGVTSTIFLFLWYFDLSFLSTLSFIGLLVTMADYCVPIVIPWLIPPEDWTADKERKLESIFKNLAANKIFICNMVKSFYEMRDSRPKMYCLVVITVLLFLSWIGSAINNLFLTYLLVNALLLVPGIQHRGLIEKYTRSPLEFIHNLIRSQDMKE